MKLVRNVWFAWLVVAVVIVDKCHGIRVAIDELEELSPAEVERVEQSYSLRQAAVEEIEPGLDLEEEGLAPQKQYIKKRWRSKLRKRIPLKPSASQFSTHLTDDMDPSVSWVPLGFAPNQVSEPVPKVPEVRYPAPKAPLPRVYPSVWHDQDQFNPEDYGPSLKYRTWRRKTNALPSNPGRYQPRVRNFGRRTQLSPVYSQPSYIRRRGKRSTDETVEKSADEELPTPEEWNAPRVFDLDMNLYGKPSLSNRRSEPVLHLDTVRSVSSWKPPAKPCAERRKDNTDLEDVDMEDSTDCEDNIENESRPDSTFNDDKDHPVSQQYPNHKASSETNVYSDIMSNIKHDAESTPKHQPLFSNHMFNHKSDSLTSHSVDHPSKGKHRHKLNSEPKKNKRTSHGAEAPKRRYIPHKKNLPEPPLFDFSMFIPKIHSIQNFFQDSTPTTVVVKYKSDRPEISRFSDDYSLHKMGNSQMRHRPIAVVQVIPKGQHYRTYD